MTPSPAQILASIPQWVKSADAANLVEHAEHTDKDVRKQVRKALHQLRSRGVAVPEAARQTWTFSAESLSELRPTQEERAFVDATSVPGATQFYLVRANAEYGGAIFFATLDGKDRVLNFEGYGQTDGQRARLLKRWERDAGGHTVPLEWVRARLRWSREVTIESGYSVPAALDEILHELGDAPAVRPPSFLASLLAGVEAAAVSTEEELVSRLGAQTWPVYFAAESLMNAVGAKLPVRGSDENVPVPQRRAEFRQAVAASITGDLGVRAFLAGPAANRLEDAAVAAWLSGSDAWARRALNEAESLRQAEAPEAGTVGIVLVEVQLIAAQRQWQAEQAESAAAGR